jgi:hypothetical protein
VYFGVLCAIRSNCLLKPQRFLCSEKEIFTVSVYVTSFVPLTITSVPLNTGYEIIAQTRIVAGY